MGSQSWHTHTDTIEGRRVVVVDGNTMHGTRTSDTRPLICCRPWTTPRALCCPRMRMAGKSNQKSQS